MSGVAKVATPLRQRRSMGSANLHARRGPAAHLTILGLPALGNHDPNPSAERCSRIHGTGQVHLFDC